MLASIEAAADRWLQDDVIDIDTQRTGGLLELVFPDDSRIVVNLQPPLHEIWLAARAGGYHYRHVQGRWLDTRDGSEFFEALSHHASAQAARRCASRWPERPARLDQRLNRSRMLLRSSLVGAGGSTSSSPRLRTPWPWPNSSKLQSPSAWITPSGGVSSCTGTPFSA